MIAHDQNHKISTFTPSRYALAANVLFAITAEAQYIAKHTFSINDVIGGFDGTTYADDKSILCGADDSVQPCESEVINEDGTLLFPIDSEFGFEVADFLGAKGKTRDGIYTEGFAGNITEGPEVVGIRVSNVATDTYKAPARFGPWCSGMGGTSVKCSSEHYTVMEHILSCHEAVPYLNADPDTGTQQVITIETDDGPITTDCSTATLDNQAYIVSDGVVTASELDYATPFNSMEANDNTKLLEDIAVTDDFSVTLKDDGKLLFRWGNMVKRPNDIRLQAKIALPDAWKADGANVTVYAAYLVMDHLITNNPNDQLRAEDLENEGATGRKPSYQLVDDGRWESIKLCHEGDADLIEEGTVLKNPPFANIVAERKQRHLRRASDSDHRHLTVGDVPYQTSDLVGGLTNAFYTTLDRDPFEWSYRLPGADTYNEFKGFLEPLSPNEEDVLGVTLVSGPRWRLRANKFGQDIPGLEIPKQECSKPPFKNDNIKYEVGERVQTWINLLDWNTDETSPLAFSPGWTDHSENHALDGVVCENEGAEDERCISQNGLELTDDFDLAVYIKGDKKPTDIYSATLILDYEGGPEAWIFNLKMEILGVEPVNRIEFGDTVRVTYRITNEGPNESSSVGIKYTLSYHDTKTIDQPPSVSVQLDAMEPGDFIEEVWEFTAPSLDPEEEEPTSSVNAQIVAQLHQAFDDLNPDDDKDTLKIQIKKVTEEEAEAEPFDL